MKIDEIKTESSHQCTPFFTLIGNYNRHRNDVVERAKTFECYGNIVTHRRRTYVFILYLYLALLLIKLQSVTVII